MQIRMTVKQKNTFRRFMRAAKKLGADSIQKSEHGCGKISAQGFNAGKLVIDWNI